MSNKTIVFWGTGFDRQYLPRLKECVNGATTYVRLEPITTIFEVISYAKKVGASGVVSTSQVLLSKLLGKEHERKQPSLDNYAGSLFKRDGIEIVFINPLEHLVTVSYSKFLATRFISKLTAPENWNLAPQFNWEILSGSNADRIFSDYQSAALIAVDIETYKQNLAIRCIGYTAVFLDASGIRTHSVVFPIDSDWALAWMRKFNWELKAPKIFQNGKYDVSYLSRYNAVPYNYLWDTATMFHCLYSELPKDLGFLGAFFVREAMYWKDLADTNDLEQYYLYNCRDHWTTALVAIEWFLQAPDWAKQNYLLEFPLIFPCHLSEMTGIKRDTERLATARKQVDDLIASKTASLNKILGVDNFNVNSPIQMKALLKILGCADLESADEKNLKKAAFRHPLNAHIIDLIVGDETSSKIEDNGIRGLRKLKSTYLRTDDDITKTSPRGGKEYKGRILYALNPHGTDTGRLASREHHFWCGLQIQNIPRGVEVKQTLSADNSFRFAEADLEQAESRDTAHISGDAKLIAAVSGTRDFHSVNASAFFGKSYEDIYDDSIKKTKDKPLRDLSKRVNHGANYNMGPNVLVETMGLKNIETARKLLKLPRLWTPKQIAEYLLEQFHKTYTSLKRVYYPAVVHEILTTRRLVGATGWTRYCFGNPKENKRDLNAYTAHCPQSLNAMGLNKAFMKVFYEIALPPLNSQEYQTRAKNFKLCAQIHDSILFQFREGHEHLAQLVKSCMEIPKTVKGYDGITRIYTVPAAVKAGKDGLGVKYWSETE